MPLSKDLQRPTKTSKDLIIGNQNVVLSTNLEWVTAETAKASSNLINKLGLLSLVLPKLEKQIRYTVYKVAVLDPNHIRKARITTLKEIPGTKANGNKE